jgi:hypothetical protein
MIGLSAAVMLDLPDKFPPLKSAYLRQPPKRANGRFARKWLHVYSYAPLLIAKMRKAQLRRAHVLSPQQPKPKPEPIISAKRDGLVVRIKWAIIIALVGIAFKQFTGMQETAYQTQTDVAVLKQTTQDTRQDVRDIRNALIPQRREAMR